MPPASVIGTSEHWRAQTLIAFLFIGAFVAVLGACIAAPFNTGGFWESEALRSSILFSLQLFFFYGVARFYSPPAALNGVIISTVISLWLIALSINGEAGLKALYFYAAINMFIGMFTSKKVLVLLFIFELIIFLTAPYMFANVTWEQVVEGPFIFTVTLTALKSVADYHQSIKEHRRRHQLEQSEERYRNLIDSMGDAVAILDLDGNFLSVNKAALLSLGVSKAELMTRGFADFVLSEDMPLIVNSFEQLKAGKNPASFIVRARFATGAIVMREILMSLTRSADGSMTITGVSRDVTERYLAQEALRASETRYRIIADALSDFAFCILIQKTDEIIYEWVTDSFEAITGLNIQEKRVKEIFCTPEMYDETIVAIAEGKTILERREVEVPMRQGEPHTFMIYRQLIISADSGRLYIAAQDMTQRKAEAQRTIVAALEQQRIAMSTAFVRAISHDFRTWLATIETSRHLIERILPEVQRATVQPKLDMISHAVEHLTAQLENLRTVTAINQPLQQPCQVQDLLEYLVLSKQRDADAKGIHLTCALPAHLPQVDANSDQLSRAFRHLLENALTYTPSGGTVDVRARVYETQIIIEIEDNGVGIAPEHLSHIFEMFYRADEARSIDLGGVGLGLSIVKMVVEAFNGKVTVRSTPDQGSTFTVSLPIFNEVTRPHA